MTTDSGTAGEASPDVVMYWLRAQRSRLITHDYFLEKVFRYCQLGAERAGMDLRIISPDDIVVMGTPSFARVVVSGETVDPRTCFFHTKLMTWPDSVGDTWRMLSVTGLLEAAGFHTTVPASVNIAANDKLLTVLRHSVPGVDWLPTIRISTRQFGWLPFENLGMDFPLIVKPANWGGGNGVMRAENRRELETILQLAGAGELTMVIQPWLGEGVVDYRVYCVDGQPHRAVTRTPVSGALVGNVHQGGVAQVVEVPEALRSPAEKIATSLGLPYTCVDFLALGDRYWLSEVEVDGGSSVSDELADARFGAYRRSFDRFVRGLPWQGAVQTATGNGAPLPPSPQL